MADLRLDGVGEACADHQRAADVAARIEGLAEEARGEGGGP